MERRRKEGVQETCEIDKQGMDRIGSGRKCITEEDEIGNIRRSEQCSCKSLDFI